MPDIAHLFGADLSLSATGDLAPISGPALAQQRVLRRLLTNPGDYIWHLDYGAGLAGLIGTPAAPDRIRALIRSQIFREAAVARTPEPVIDVQADSAGTVFVQIHYADAATGTTQLLSFSAGSP
jgi:phage baseplate assembly protein W